MTEATGGPQLLLGSCPDSWGVWFPDDPKQTPWHRFLDELTDVGYRWVELGPYGYLPTDPDRLREKLEKRGLRVSGQAVYAPLQHGDQWSSILDEARQIAQLVTAVGGRFVVVLPGYYRDERILNEEYGLALAFHPHADTHVETQDQVERFLNNTDPQFVSLCLDTGHFAYRHGDNAGLIRKYPERIGFVHIKGVDPDVLRSVDEENMSFGEAVKRGVMAEPPKAEPKIEPIVEALAELDVEEMFVIVEQDLYPCDPDVPKPIAKRTCDYLRSLGVGV